MNGHCTDSRMDRIRTYPGNLEWVVGANEAAPNLDHAMRPSMIFMMVDKEWVTQRTETV